MSPSLRARAALRIAARLVDRDETDHLAARRRLDRVAAPPNRRVHTDPVELGGVPCWRAVPRAVTPTRHLLHVHSGGYVIGSAKGSRGWIGELADRVGASVHSVEYRLAPEHPFPAALDDCVAAYRGLLEVTGPERVALVGESAGGGAVVATCLAAREQGLPMPAAVVALSPWADLTLSGPSMAANEASDPIIGANLAAWRDAYAGAVDPADPLLSPALADLAGLPPMRVEATSTERLLDDARTLAERAEAAGVAVDLVVHDGLWHVFQLLAPVVPEATAAVDAIASWLVARVPAPADERA